MLYFFYIRILKLEKMVQILNWYTQEEWKSTQFPFRVSTRIRLQCSGERFDGPSCSTVDLHTRVSPCGLFYERWLDAPVRNIALS